MEAERIKMKKHDPSKREFVKKAAYAAPAVLTLTAAASVAKAGSEKEDCDDNERDHEFDWWSWLRRLFGF